MGKILKAPFQYFGGKSLIAQKVWSLLGNCNTYIEPFFGSGAILLNRPFISQNNLQIVNDLDCNICNVWRSIKYNIDDLLLYFENPINHVDLHARRNTLIRNQNQLLEKLLNDEIYCDPKLAAYWVWGTCCWIASGFLEKETTIKPNDIGLTAKIPEITVEKGLIAIKNKKQYLLSLKERLKNVKVICGDWKRLFGGNWQTNKGTCGIFLDPPYGFQKRKEDLYNNDSFDVSKEVRKWCVQNGNKKDFKIIICGYADQHDQLLQYGWKSFSWKTNGGYGNQGNGQGKINANLQKIWYNKNCIEENWLF